MKLYTIQSLEVISILYKYRMYSADFSKCSLCQDESEKRTFEPAYRWMMEQYNRIKNNEYSAAPVWWYTDKKDALEQYIKHEDFCGTVLIKAEVPDKFVLLHDFEEWHGVLNQWDCGWRGHHLHMSNDWTKHDNELSDKLYDLYKQNTKAMEETWKNIFNIRKNGNQIIHAVTPYIAIKWLIKDFKYSDEEQSE